MSKIFAIDFDGTIVEDAQEPFDPEKVGTILPDACQVITKLKDKNNKIIIYTVRDHLPPVEKCLRENNIPYDVINKNIPGDGTTSPKPFAHYYIDNNAIRFTTWKDIDEFFKNNDTDDELLFATKWHKIFKNQNNYEYSQNIPGVGILPYKVVDNKREFLLRKENNPIVENGYMITIITGRCDNNEEIRESATRELKEESGYFKSPNEFEYLGELMIGKENPIYDHLYCVNITGCNEEGAKGDGTIYENNSNNFWVSEEELIKEAVSNADCYLSGIVLRYLNMHNILQEKEPFDRIKILEKFLKCDFIKELLSEIFDYENSDIFDLIKFGNSDHLAFYDVEEQCIVFDYQGFHTLLYNDIPKLYKVLIHELTHLIDDVKGQLVIPTEDIIDNYFTNPSEIKAIENEIKFFKFLKYSTDEIKNLFSKSFDRFGEKYTEAYREKLNSIIENN